MPSASAPHPSFPRNNSGGTKVYTASVGRRGIETLDEYRELSLDAAIRQRLRIEDDVDDAPRRRVPGVAAESAGRDAEDAAAVVLPYAHEGNALTASGNPEDFLPVSAGGKLKDKNHKVVYLNTDRSESFCSYCTMNAHTTNAYLHNPARNPEVFSRSLIACAFSELLSRVHVQPGVIFYTRDSDDEVYDSDEDPDDDLDI